MNDLRQGSEKAFSTFENTRYSCKIRRIRPVEMATDPADLQNNFGRI